mgnify:CR=1 FL=1
MLIYYNLDAIIAVGFRVNSARAIQFRQWATGVLQDYAIRGYVLDKERLKNGSFLSNEYFENLLAEIREIRASERKFYQKITDIYATAIDYDPRSDLTKTFFATVQNKLHFAVHAHTAAELIHDRVDSDKPLVGMTSFKGDYITKDDVKIAKNYLSERELSQLNLLVAAFLDLAEFQAAQEQPMSMADWGDALDRQILAVRREVLKGTGRVSHQQAIEKAEKEFAIYRAREMKQLESDFDRAIKALAKSKDPLQKEKGDHAEL